MPPLAAAFSLWSSDSAALLKLILIGLFFIAVWVAVFWGNWHKYKPSGFLYFCGALLCIASGVIFALHSTLPSSAPRREVQGRVVWMLAHHHGKSTDYTFAIRLDNGALMSFREAAIVSRSAQGELIDVTYLDERVSNEFPRAIAYKILTGPAAGDARSVSADWLGPWLGVPLSLIAGAWLLVLANRNKRSKP
jgi:hypothetical protein